METRFGSLQQVSWHFGQTKVHQGNNTELTLCRFKIWRTMDWEGIWDDQFELKSLWSRFRKWPNKIAFLQLHEYSFFKNSQMNLCTMSLSVGWLITYRGQFFEFPVCTKISIPMVYSLDVSVWLALQCRCWLRWVLGEVQSADKS